MVAIYQHHWRIHVFYFTMSTRVSDETRRARANERADAAMGRFFQAGINQYIQPASAPEYNPENETNRPNAKAAVEAARAARAAFLATRTLSKNTKATGPPDWMINEIPLRTDYPRAGHGVGIIAHDQTGGVHRAELMPARDQIPLNANGEEMEVPFEGTGHSPIHYNHHSVLQAEWLDDPRRQMQARMQHPDPTHTPMQGPIHTPMQGPIHTPMQGPIHTPMQGPIHMPVQGHTPMQITGFAPSVTHGFYRDRNTGARHRLNQLGPNHFRLEPVIPIQTEHDAVKRWMESQGYQHHGGDLYHKFGGLLHRLTRTEQGGYRLEPTRMRGVFA